jgi:hypothetical protein
MRVFWTAWLMSIASLIGAAMLAALLIKETTNVIWPAMLIGRSVALLTMLVGLVCAFRLALKGTTALKSVLARNLAMLISSELGALSFSARHHIISLDAFTRLQDGGAALTLHTEALVTPEFVEKQHEIRNLLGKPTEQSLRQLLEHVNTYNSLVRELELSSGLVDTSEGKELVTQMCWLVGKIEDCTREAGRFVTPFYLPQV